MSLVEFFFASLGTSIEDWRLAADWLRRVAEDNHRFLLLLDGWDEVPIPARDAVREQILAEQNSFITVITSRPSGLPRQFGGGEQFDFYHVAGLTNSAIEDLVRKSLALLGRTDLLEGILGRNGKRYAQTLNTTNPRDANSLKGGIEKTIMLLQQHVLKVPDAVDPLTFIMAGGELPPPQLKPKEKQPETKPAEKSKHTDIRTLKQLCDRYAQTLALSVEENSLATVKMHLRHVTRFFGVDFNPNDIAPGRLQEYIEHRARRKGIRKRPLSAYTIRKELTTFRAAWNWAKQMLLIEPAFPDAPLKFPKMREKQPFQTFAEIERRIAAGVSDTERKELWDCLFLSIGEINELLDHVKATAQQPFVYPMFCFAAHTGVRRSEMLRLKKSDIDLSSSVALIHEKKRVRGTTTTRRVTLSPFLKGVLSEWLASHPGGQHLFSQHVAVFRSRKRRLEATPVTRNEATDHFERTLAESKWTVVRGWHAFRHSFASNCAAAGIDQRLIDEWLGHQTEEMRRRYRHCFPNQQEKAIQTVFGTANP